MLTAHKFKKLDGSEPFSDWFNGLDRQVQASIDAYVTRTRMGAAKRNVKRLAGKQERDVWEIRIDKGPGYRVYFARPERDVILLLTGGIKKTQPRDIERAVKYWRAYRVSQQSI